MKQNFEQLLKDIINKTAFLFLGQSYLKVGSGEDLFLSSLRKKYSKEESSAEGYDVIQEIDFETEKEEKLAWMFKMSEKLSVPRNFESIATIPWSGVYTSSIDNLLTKNFESEWRTTQPIYSEKQISDNPRSRHELNINYLFGSISQSDSDNRIPLTRIEKVNRLNKINTWLSKFSELLTTNGKLIIEGYDPDTDWLEIEKFYTIINSLTKNQTFFFSFREDYLKNEFISDLIKNEKLVPVYKSLSEVIDECKAENDFALIPDDDSSLYGKWLNIHNKRVKIPIDLKSRLLKSALILDDTLLTGEVIENQNERYLNFKNFLSSGSNQPYWKGYDNGFAFERDFVAKAAKKIEEYFNLNEQIKNPLIVYGQSSSGKTIGLGHLAYFFAEDLKYPVLYIPRNYVNLDESEIDVFCEWVEDHGAKYTIVIWDGMIDSDAYFSLQNKLNGRGRKALVIGSNYKTPKEEHLYKRDYSIEVPIDLSKAEMFRLKNYLEKNIPEGSVLANLLERVHEKNFLAILYRYLPETKRNIQKGLSTEISKFSKYIIKNATSSKPENTVTRLAELLMDAGFESSEIEDKEVIIDTDSYKLTDQFIYYIMIPGKFGLSIPFELLLRCLGAEVFTSSIFRELKKTDIIKWTEDKLGNIYLEPRTAIEAEILCYSLGSKKAQVEIIKDLIKNLRIDISRSDISKHDDPIEVNFAVDLLRNVGPNPNSDYDNDSLLDIAKTLAIVRQNLEAYHPRLVLQEASFYREVAKKGHKQGGELLSIAEEILNEELDILREGSNSPLQTYFKVELASTLGTKVHKLLKNDQINKQEVLQYYNYAKREVFSSKEESPENYPALDVIFWTTRDLIKSEILSDVELIEIEADLFHIIDFVQMEGIDENYHEKFEQRKYQIGQALKKREVSEEAFESLKSMGSTLGFYVKARNLIEDVNFSSNHLPSKSDFESLRVAYEFLDENVDSFSDDPKCIYLKFRIWWLINASKPLFYDEKMTIPFSEKQWLKVLEYTSLLKSLNNLYETPTLLYQEGLAHFHLEAYDKSIATFKLLSRKSDNSNIYGSRRIIKNHIASDQEGTPKLFDGEAVFDINRSDKTYKGLIYVNQIRKNVPFMLNDFNMKQVKRGFRFRNLVIAFNFRGPIAFPKERITEIK